MTTRDEAVSAEVRQSLKGIATALDQVLNGDPQDIDKSIAFVLLIAPFNRPGLCNYISNGNRSDVVSMMKEIVERFEKDMAA